MMTAALWPGHMARYKSLRPHHVTGPLVAETMTVGDDEAIHDILHYNTYHCPNHQCVHSRR